MSHHDMIAHMMKAAAQGGGIAMVACGVYHTMVLTDAGEVFGWGSNTNGQVNPADLTSPYVTVPTIVKTGVVYISCTTNTTMCLLANGDVVGWGKNNMGQVNPLSATTPWLDPDNVVVSGMVRMEAGGDKVHCLTESGDLHGWGYNYYGMCNWWSATSPWLDPEHVIRSGVALLNYGNGGNHTAVVMDNGDYEGWGSNTQRNVDPVNSSTKTYKVLPASTWPSPIKEILGEGVRTQLLLENGDVYGWGKNQYGEVNPNAPLTTWLGYDTLIKAGVNTLFLGAFHTLAHLADDTLVGWGKNDYRQCHPESVTTPYLDDTAVIRSGIVQGQGANHYTIALTDNNDVVGWGRNPTFWQCVHPTVAVDPYLDITTPIVNLG